jgi:CheY-like chemotaxis protein
MIACEARGCRVTKVSDGVSLVLVLKGRRVHLVEFDLILFDEEDMPKLSGVEDIQGLRRWEKEARRLEELEVSSDDPEIRLLDGEAFGSGTKLRPF